MIIYYSLDYDKLQMRISMRKCEKSLDEVLAQTKIMKSKNFNQGCRLFADLTSSLTYLDNLKVIHHNHRHLIFF